MQGASGATGRRSRQVRVRRTQTSAVRDRLCPDLDAGARIIGVVDHGSDLELSELAGHLIRIPIRGAGRQDDYDYDHDSASAASRARGRVASAPRASWWYRWRL